MSLDEFSSHKVVLPAPSLPLPMQGGREQRSATTSLPPHLYQVGKGSIPYPSPPCKGWHVPWVIEVPYVVSHDDWPTQKEKGLIRMWQQHFHLHSWWKLKSVFYADEETHLTAEVLCCRTVTPHKMWPAVPSAAGGTDLRSASSCPLPPGFWIHEGSEIKR